MAASQEKKDEVMPEIETIETIEFQKCEFTYPARPDLKVPSSFCVDKRSAILYSDAPLAFSPSIAC